ncbi:MAG: hypothetical protein D3X82_01275 [Candidatus Leucobacter sulfamidivorax]|nr:hypothetical protein [Candidatus Leucobacter sulfamidivorax]
MAKGVSLSVASDTKDFLNGIKRGVIEPLEDVSDVLQDVKKDGDRAGEQLEDSMRDAQKDTEKLAREYDELNKKVREAGRGGRDIGDGVKAGTDRAAEATAEFKDEALQNLSETVSSFRGDASDIAQVVQDTFGGVVSNLGPLGAAAGVAGAIGIGLMMKGFEDAEKAEQEFRERVQELAQVLIETGGEGADALDAVADRLMDMVAPTDENAISLSKLRREAELSGVEFRDLALAYAGAGGDLNAFIEKSDEAAEAARDAQLAAQQSSTESVLAAGEQYVATAEVSQGLRDLADAQAEAAAEARLFNETGLASAAARAEQMRTLQGELDEVMGSWDEYQDKETGALDPAGYITAMQARRDATANFNTNVQQLATEFGLSHDEVQAILDQGVDFAPMLQSILDSGMGAEYASQVRSMLDGGQAIVDGSPINQTVTAVAETETAGERFAALVAPQTARITAEADTKHATLQLDDFTSRRRTAAVEAVVNTGTANTILNNWVNQQRDVYVTFHAVDREGRPLP